MNNVLNMFGFEIKRKKTDQELLDSAASFVPPQQEEADGGFVVNAGGHFGSYVDMEGSRASTEKDLILKYRDISQIPECDAAIDDIVNESISSDEDSAPVEIILDDLEQSDKVKGMITEEFEHIVSLLNLNWYGHDIFRRFYIDGRLYYHKIINPTNPKEGLIEVRPIDSTKIRKIKEIIRNKDPKTGVDIVTGYKEYYIYEDNGIGGTAGTAVSTGIQVSKDSITQVTSGLLDSSRTTVLSHLHKALKPANQLRMMEDSLVIYRMSRAPERRIFYIDVGNLPKGKAEEYLRSIMNNYRNKMVYDASTGEMQNDNKHMSILEDFWLPRREGGRGTEISTLPGGESLGQIDDIIYFQKRLYKSLNVPASRLDTEQQAMISLGRTSETTREELKFQKFIGRLRKRFSMLLIDLLRTQLILKGVVTEEEWNDIRQDITIDFIKDSHFAEMKSAELTRERIMTLREVDEYVGRYYSAEWVRKNVLHQTDEDIKNITAQIEAEKAAAPDDEDDMDFEETNIDLPVIVDEEIEEVEEVISEKKMTELEESQLRLIQSMTKIIEE